MQQQQPIQDPLMKQIQEMKQKEERQQQEIQKQQSASPEKKITEKKEQPVNMLQLYFEQKKKKLGFCSVDIFTTHKPAVQEETLTLDFGIQCDIEPTTKTSYAAPQHSESQDFDEMLPAQIQQHRRLSKRRVETKEQLDKLAQLQQVEKEPRVVTHEEITSILKSQPFNDFFNKSSKIVEKALYRQEVDALEQLMANDKVEQDDDLKDILTHQVNFYDQTFSYNRVVTALQWSPTLPETFLVGYGQNDEGSINDQVGVLLIWSLQLKSRPEFYCFCQSPITSAVFHPFQPSVVLGGLYNGQLVIWDMRSKQTPEKRTSMSSGGHSYPIYSVSVVGSQNAHNIISVSNDGKLCVWNLAMLNAPQKTVEMKCKQKQGQQSNSEINATNLCFPPGDANNFYVGGEDGNIYYTQLHPNQQSQENQYQLFEDHTAPITGLSVNDPQQQASPIFNNLLLSSSFDWTVKLWNPRLQKDQCLLTFESAEDYVYDVSWNGNHPTLFSSVDGEGYVDLWDIGTDLETPISKYKTGNNSLNKQQWNNDGSKLAVGDSQGTVQILQLDKRALKIDQQKINNAEAFIRSKR